MIYYCSTNIIINKQVETTLEWLLSCRALSIRDKRPSEKDLVQFIGLSLAGQTTIFSFTWGPYLRALLRAYFFFYVRDFNLPQIDWNNDIVHGSDNSYAALFYNTVQDAYMTQHVKQPTRRRLRQTPSVLDLIFTADPNMISDLLHCLL